MLKNSEENSSYNIKQVDRFSRKEVKIDYDDF